MPCCVLHRLETRTTGKSGLPGGTVASFNRFLGVPLFGEAPFLFEEKSELRHLNILLLKMIYNSDSIQPARGENCQKTFRWKRSL